EEVPGGLGGWPCSIADRMRVTSLMGGTQGSKVFAKRPLPRFLAGVAAARRFWHVEPREPTGPFFNQLRLPLSIPAAGPHVLDGAATPLVCEVLSGSGGSATRWAAPR